MPTALSVNATQKSSSQKTLKISKTLLNVRLGCLRNGALRVFRNLILSVTENYTLHALLVSFIFLHSRTFPAPQATWGFSPMRVTSSIPVQTSIPVLRTGVS